MKNINTKWTNRIRKLTFQYLHTSEGAEQAISVKEAERKMWKGRMREKVTNIVQFTKRTYQRKMCLMIYVRVLFKARAGVLRTKTYRAQFQERHYAPYRLQNRWVLLVMMGKLRKRRFEAFKDWWKLSKKEFNGVHMVCFFLLHSVFSKILLLTLFLFLRFSLRSTCPAREHAC